jgi:hypothetical protein
LGSAQHSRVGTGVQGPVASISRTKPGISPSEIGAALRASATMASPSSQVRLVKSVLAAGGDHLLHSIEKPSSAMRGDAMSGPVEVELPPASCSGVMRG